MEKKGFWRGKAPIRRSHGRQSSAMLACHVGRGVLMGLVVVLGLVVDATSAPPLLDSSGEHRILQNTTLDGGTCPPCPTCKAPQVPDEDPTTLQILVVDSQGIIDMVAWNARDYFEYTGGRVKVEIKLAPTMPALFEEIENDARSGGGLFDAYYTNPVILGTAAMLNGFLDLTPFVKENPLADWTDVLLALRTHVTSFEGKTYILLLDGDTHTMFYRKDVLDAYGLKPPRSWNEYIQTARMLNGTIFNGNELTGSCVSRLEGDHAMYWSHLVLSSITQTEGTASGSLFDTKDMTPLTGEAVAEMLRIQEEQNRYGPSDEFEKRVNLINNLKMNEGSCVLTFMWGDLFRRSKAEGSVLHDKLGVAPTPGSEFVLNRKTGRLEKCTKELCPYAKFYEDLGFVNSAPYAANGGWGAAISANTTPEKQKALADFFIWASSRKQSQQYVIPNATLPWYEINGQDPWRKSQLDVDKWVAQGYDRDLSKQFVESINSNLVSKNVVIEARFPKAGEIMGVLDKEVHDHLIRASDNYFMPEDWKRVERLRVAQSLTDQWNRIIKEYDQRGDTVAPILEIYQRLRGVYVPNEQKNQLKGIRALGLTLMAVVLLSSIGCASWVSLKRERGVVKASQPPFLALICVGTFVMGSAIIPMGIDDGQASASGVSVACMATPWLVAIGFSICFAALFSKIWRLNMLAKNAMSCRRIKIVATDVLLPFTVLLFLNVIFLLIWTLTDPLKWERVDSGRTGSGDPSSYGRCSSSGVSSTVMLVLIAVTNIIALALANFQAYQTRNLRVAFKESKYIALSMASILQAFFIGVPLLFLADGNPTSNYVVRSLLVFAVCVSTLGFIFIPKFLAGKKKQERRPNIPFYESNIRNSMGRDAEDEHMRDSTLPLGSSRNLDSKEKPQSSSASGNADATDRPLSWSSSGNLDAAERQQSKSEDSKETIYREKVVSSNSVLLLSGSFPSCSSNSSASPPPPQKGSLGGQE